MKKYKPKKLLRKKLRNRRKKPTNAHLSMLSRDKHRRMMEELYEVPYVGDVRGKGLLVGVEIVADKQSKIPFDQNWGKNITLQGPHLQKVSQSE